MVKAANVVYRQVFSDASDCRVQVVDSVDTFCFTLQLTFQSVPNVFNDVEIQRLCWPGHSPNFVCQSVFYHGTGSKPI